MTLGSDQENRDANSSKFVISVRELLPEYKGVAARLDNHLYPYAVIDDVDIASNVGQPSGELAQSIAVHAHVCPAHPPDEKAWGAKERWRLALDVRAPANAEVRSIQGRLFLPVLAENGEAGRGREKVIGIESNQAHTTREVAVLKPFEFTISADVLDRNQGKYAAFHEHLEKRHDRILWLNRFRGLPGRAWFQTQRDLARLRQGKSIKDNARRDVRQLGDDFGFFSGTRAITENIQLNRGFADADATDDDREMVLVDSIEGITVEEFDWKELTKNAQPTVDLLAGAIPHDQHVVFLDSITDAITMLDRSESLLVPTLATTEQSPWTTPTIDFYLHQMQLDLADLAKQPFAADVKQIALTGGDPYSELGTDIGVVVGFASEESAGEFFDHVAGPDPALPDGIEESVDEWRWQRSIRDEQGSVRLSLQADGNTVILSNSELQLARIMECRRGAAKNLGELDEYRFFRDRYQHDDAETAFVFMSDAAIRRWCGPRWRIGQARRLSAARTLNQLQALFLDDIVQLKPGETRPVDRTKIPARLIDAEFLDRLGTLALTSDGVVSENYGSTRWMVPISDLALDVVSAREATAYERWRERYQRNWSGSYDPIGIQIKSSASSVESDITVMPLIGSSRYLGLINGPTFGPLAGSVHGDAIGHFASSINLGWLGGSPDFGLNFVDVFCDDSDEWEKLIDESDRWTIPEEHYDQIPVGVTLTCSSEKSRSRIEALVGMFATDGETREEVKGTDIEGIDLTGLGITVHRARIKSYGHDDNHALPWVYVGSVENDLLISCHPATFQKMLLRRQLQLDLDADRITQEQFQQKIGKPDRWLGKNASFRLNSRLIELATKLENHRAKSSSGDDWIRKGTHSNLLILNEWKRMYPDADALQLHQRLWNQRLQCQFGGQLVWDADRNEHRSTQVGSAGNPLTPTQGTLPKELSLMDRLSAGVTLEKNGLRGRLKIKFKKP